VDKIRYLWYTVSR